MKALFISLCLSLLMILSSCEGRTGYLDEGQQNTVTMLTDVEWLVVYADYGLGNEQTFDDETNIYSFGRDTKGWTAVGSLKDPSIKKDVQYFQWTFTTENYTVIYTAAMVGARSGIISQPNNHLIQTQSPQKTIVHNCRAKEVNWNWPTCWSDTSRNFW